MTRPSGDTPAGLLSNLSQGLRLQLARWSAWLQPPHRSASAAPVPPETGAPPAAIQLHGSRAGWLRVLAAQDLLQVVQADRALREIMRRTRLAQPVWERDCLSAIHRYAEFVQLLPASEAHHHAHAGGLLAHTVEMLLAALTWRSGRLLPEGAPIEVIDAQRDEWTLVVFYCALLHDIAKPLTDLQVSWRSQDMSDPIRWQPMSGSLVGAATGRVGAEYLVEFAPKSQRDYRAHSRTAMLLLPQIATTTALSFLARQPAAFEAMNRYLSGDDKDSLLAQIVREADKASTRRALQSGNRARFATASAVPLVDLLMQGMRDMLRVGTDLPLNRSGAAAWVYDGSIWFVAKRLADATRAWIKARAPDEVVPGEAKNDRLFDTWQEYGCLMPNPQSGQAIWYVTVRGQGADPVADGAAEPGRESASYEHSLSVLRFPLKKVFADPAHYPPPMQGRIDVLSRRGAAEAVADSGVSDVATANPQEAQVAAVQAGKPVLHEDAAVARQETAAHGVALEDAPTQGKKREAAAAVASGANRSAGQSSERAKAAMKPQIKPPAFNKPKSVKAESGAADQPRQEAAAVAAEQRPAADPEMAMQVQRPDQGEDAAMVRRRVFEELDDDYLLDAAESAPTIARTDRDATDRARARRSLATPLPVAGGARSQPKTTQSARDATPKLVASQSSRQAPPSLLQPATTFLVPPRPTLAVQDEHAADPVAKSGPDETGPTAVLLQPKLPAVRGEHEAAAKATPLALEFMHWVQTSLVERRIKYNETGAVVHFVPQGMALVSPLIFNLFAEDRGKPEHAINDYAMQVQRELVRAGWHLAGPNRTNIIKFGVLGRGGAVVGKLAAVVLTEPSRWVLPVPPSNPVLRVE